MSDFLVTMAAGSRARSAAAQVRTPRGALEEEVAALAPAPQVDWDPTFSLIAEIKARSPALGALANTGTLDRAALARAYAGAGASAVSVLTEPDRFDGTLGHLGEVTAALGRAAPAMRKDFLVDTYQILEARVAGAGGVLLIAAMLDDTALSAMLAVAGELGLFVLLECFDADDVRRSTALAEAPAGQTLRERGQLLLGINTRNLRTLAVDGDRLATLAPLLPAALPAVAESGLTAPADAARVVELGYQVALVGTALMQSADPGATVAQFLRAGRGR
ncbi:MAG: indole-3-glycerol-phosphate synthase TrpC [Pseudomonadota bacterium]